MKNCLWMGRGLETRDNHARCLEGLVIFLVYFEVYSIIVQSVIII